MSDLNREVEITGSGQVFSGETRMATTAEVAATVAAQASPVFAAGAKTTTREENVAGLASAIALANEARLDIISHFGNTDRHPTGAQSTTGIAPAATSIASLVALTTSLMALYVLHNEDAVLASEWQYHDAQATAKALASEVPPTNLQESITKLNDLKVKYNEHEELSTGHEGGTVAGDEIEAANAAYGAANLTPVAGVQAGDLVVWGILNDGTGDVTGVSAVAGAGGVTFTFSADPQNDAIISYMVMRPAAA